MTKVIQYHSAVIKSDAIGTSIRLLHESLIKKGIVSLIACADSNHHLSAPGVLPASTILNANMGTHLNENDVLLIHFSFADDVAEILAQLPLRRILVYHNITPGHFFHEVGLGWLGEACDRGREQLKNMAPLFLEAVGDSDFNCRELIENGYKDVKTIPVLIDETQYRSEIIDPDLFMSVRERASINILFVGRFVPNKRIERLFSMIQEFKRNFPSTICLHLVGKIWDNSYFASLINQAATAGVLNDVQFHTDAEPLRLRTLYAAADAFVSMSDHEGFMVPIVEAFASGCPVIAWDGGAMGETMGGAGLRMSAPDPSFAAGLIHMLSIDHNLKNRIVAGQSRRAADFSLWRVGKRWTDKIKSSSSVS